MFLITAKYATFAYNVLAVSGGIFPFRLAKIRYFSLLNNKYSTKYLKA